ncbi:hypothetical protein LCGC14_0564950 [marine sediment metagenome]|uniref:Uncharacterized protein n=1 Tax=marine sediment metagenome TaxID=412755 RepID=A0A0F9S4H5_9ZZZZ
MKDPIRSLKEWLAQDLSRSFVYKCGTNTAQWCVELRSRNVAVEVGSPGDFTELVHTALDSFDMASKRLGQEF